MIVVINTPPPSHSLSSRVEALFLEMAQEPLLRMAISRGPQTSVSELQEEVGRGAFYNQFMHILRTYCNF